jgi:hypothetical protein
MLRAVNGHIGGVTPFAKSKQAEKVQVGGMIVNAGHVELVSAQVIVGSYEFRKGSTVYFPGSAAAQAWAKERHSIGGVEFVRAPESAVVFVEEPEAARPPPTPMPGDGS